MIMNTITIVDLLNTSIHSKHGFLKFCELSLRFISFQEIFVGKLTHISYKLLFRWLGSLLLR